MEGNKDEALRCLEIARKHYSDGNLPQAIKFVTKSLNLYPTDTARDLLTIYENKQKHSSAESSTSHNSNPRPSTSSSSSQSAPRPSPSSSSSSSPSASSSTSPVNERAYTQEQLQAVQRVRRLKDYYEILEITKDAKEGDIKKAYRKIALVLHPDKNGAPGAEDAFKAVSKAFACLSDPEARKRYDVHGPDAPTPSASPFGRRHHHGFESELTPEQIFEMMFGMGRPPGGGFRTYTYRTGGAGGGAPRRQQQQQGEPDLMSVLIQFLPILLLGLLFFVFASGGEEAKFSLQRTGSYIYLRETEHWGVPYWVKLETEQKLNRRAMDLGTLEREVERYWKADKEKKCSYEHQQKNKMERAAYYASAQEKEYLKEKISNFQMPNCEDIRRVS